MADLFSALEGLYDTVRGFVQDLKIDGVPIQSNIMIDWPSEQSFHAVAQCPDETCLIALTDMNQTLRKTRALQSPVRKIKYPTGIKATLSSPVLDPNGTATCTIAYAIDSSQVNALDGIGLVAHRGVEDAGAVAIGNKGESLGSLAAKFRDQINSDTALNQWISASATGAVLTVTNLTGELIKIEANVGNVQDHSRETGSTTARVMISVFCASQDVRKIVGSKIETELSEASRRFGFKIADDNDVRLKLIFPRISRDNSLVDLYRQDFVCDMTYINRRTSRAYEILVPTSETQVIENDF